MQVARSQITQDWLQTPLGDALLQLEARVVEEALDGVFGEECLQLGLWGEKRAFLRYTRTQHCSVIAASKNGEPCVIGSAPEIGSWGTGRNRLD